MKIAKVITLITLSTVVLFIIYIFTHKKEVSPYLKQKDNIAKTYRIGFSNIQHENTASKLKVKGKLPEWLNGTLLRTGPAKFHTNKSWISNWFDGLSMVYAFKFNNNSIYYTNKFLQTDDYRKVENTKIMNYRGYLSDGPFNFFSKVLKLIAPQYSSHTTMPNANVNISVLANKPVALTEIPYPVQFDINTLQTIGPIVYNDTLPQDFIQTTAHPHYDFEKQEQIGYFISFGRTSSYNIYKIKNGHTKREIIASIPTESPSYMHSFSITKNYAILVSIPLIASLWKLIFTNRGYINNFNWLPELKTKFIVVDRIKNKVIGEYQTDPFFMFHTVNAFEKENKITIDLINYQNPDILDHAFLDKLLAKQKLHYIDNSIQPKLNRYTIDLENNSVKKELISKELVEFPQINYKNYNGKDYTYVYTCSKNIFSDTPVYCLEKLLKINVKNKTIKQWTCNNCYPGEPIFVPNLNSKEEDSGVILSLVLDVSRNLSFLLILDAKSFKELARAELNYYIPFGIHGLFIDRLV